MKTHWTIEPPLNFDEKSASHVVHLKPPAEGLQGEGQTLDMARTVEHD